MAYRALYREYRPKCFNEVLGQEHITTTLKNQIVSGRVSHAYLFCGTRGTGKTSMAKIFARAINCTDTEDGEPCFSCTNCTNEAADVDIIELDAASNTGVDDMRALIEKARFTPLHLKYKVYIIDEVHMLSNSAFNALLKTLEEPPAHIVFILATTEVQKLPVTIISRCQRFDFRRLSVENMVKRMKDVIEDVGARIDDEGLLAIARAADGGMRDALSLADQCLSFCGNDVSAQDVYSVLGGMDNDFLFKMADALIDSKADEAIRLVERVVCDGRDLNVFNHDLALHMRALLITKLCGHCSDILDCTEENMKRYEEQAKRASSERLERAVSLLLGTQANMRWLTLPRVLLESTLVKITRPEDEDTLTALMDRLSRLEEEPRTIIAQPAEKPEKAKADDDLPPWEEATEEVKNEPQKKKPEAKTQVKAQAKVEPENETKAETALSSENPKEIWQAVAAELKRRDTMLYVMASKASKYSISGGTLKVGYTNGGFVKALEVPDKKRIITEILQGLKPNLTFSPYEINGKSTDDIEARARLIFGDKFEVE
ncbi:MAG: DNA polymerase III subunit gamma/tau [Clostridia bacterium]|nr:DNA polymerase III subunit gamma/tau [Clostridia bacterium]